MKELIVAVLLLAGTGSGIMVISGHGADLKDAISGAVPTDIRTATEDVRSRIPSSESEQPALDIAAERSDPRPAHAITMAIGHTDGTGVSLRSDCADDARISGGVPDGTVVSQIEHGGGRCDGWSLVAVEGVTTWVRNRYLLAGVAADPGKTGGDSGDEPKPNKLDDESNGDESAEEPGSDDAGDESKDGEQEDRSNGNRPDEGRAHSGME